MPSLDCDSFTTMVEWQLMKELMISDNILNRRGYSVTENVYRVIKDNILEWNLKPGQRISEKEIADTLEVSRTPVRESFIRLAGESLLEILPQRGTFISKIDLKEVNEGLFIRRSLELSVLRLAVDILKKEDLESCYHFLELQEKALEKKDPREFIHYDSEFHKSIYSLCDRELTWTVMQNANHQYNRLRMLTLMDIDKYSSILKEHKAILDALEQGKLSLVIEMGISHLEKLFIEESQLENKYREYFN